MFTQLLSTPTSHTAYYPPRSESRWSNTMLVWQSLKQSRVFFLSLFDVHAGACGQMIRFIHSCLCSFVFIFFAFAQSDSTKTVLHIHEKNKFKVLHVASFIVDVETKGLSRVN